jgi:hypothetical protein
MSNFDDLPPDGSDRRIHERRTISGRSAIWLDAGPKQGILGLISELSQSGFSAEPLTDPEVFETGTVIHCVLLIQQVYFDALVEVVSVRTAEDGKTKLGFRFETMSEDNRRLLDGVIRYQTNQQQFGLPT